MPDPIALHIDGVTKRYGDVVAVRGVTLRVEPGELFALLGPSGCGKTTLLRTVAGFEVPTRGSIRMGDTDVTRLGARRRPTAMVFQNYALFPTMTVGENVGYGLQVRKVARAERETRVAEALRQVDLGGLGERPVTQLSGGQQQRVALARALAVQPQILLFDEPLSNLDVALREQTRRELQRLQHQLKTTSLYVTHDQEEALALADRIAVMRAGEVVQVGTPGALYREPETAFVASFLGGSNVVRDPRLAYAWTGVTLEQGQALAIRPEHLEPDPEGPITLRLDSQQFLGLRDEWWGQAEGTTLRALVEPGTAAGETVRLSPQRWRAVRDDVA